MGIVLFAAAAVMAIVWNERRIARYKERRRRAAAEIASRPKPGPPPAPPPPPPARGGVLAQAREELPRRRYTYDDEPARSGVAALDVLRALGGVNGLADPMPLSADPPPAESHSFEGFGGGESGGAGGGGSWDSGGGGGSDSYSSGGDSGSSSSDGGGGSF